MPILTKCDHGPNQGKPGVCPKPEQAATTPVDQAVNVERPKAPARKRSTNEKYRQVLNRVNDALKKIDSGGGMTATDRTNLVYDLGQMGMVQLRAIHQQRGGKKIDARKKAELVKQIVAALGEQAFQKYQQVFQQQRAKQAEREAAVAKEAGSVKKIQQKAEEFSDGFKDHRDLLRDESVVAAARIFQGGGEELIDRYGAVAGSAIVAAAVLGKVSGYLIGIAGVNALLGPAATSTGEIMATFWGWTTLPRLAARGTAAIAAAPLIALAHVYEKVRGKRLDKAQDRLKPEKIIKLGVAWADEMEEKFLREAKAKGLFQTKQMRQRADAIADIVGPKFQQGDR